jgi:hypothetical protein
MTEVGNGGAPRHDLPLGEEETKSRMESPQSQSQATVEQQGYLGRLSSMQRNALESLYHNAVDVPCQHLSNAEQAASDVFGNITTCGGKERFDFLHFLRPPAGEDGGSASASHGGGADDLYGDVYGKDAPLGPAHCEYCGAPDLELCTRRGGCQRPVLFFQKKRPPFAQAGGWDPVTEYEAKGTRRTGSSQR